MTRDNEEVELGGKATLRCTLSTFNKIQQVTWQKQTDGNFVNVAVYKNQTYRNIIGQYKDRINFTSVSLNDTAITFWKASTQDNGCYKCIFNIFPTGPISEKTCLSVYGESFHIKIVPAQEGKIGIF